MSDRLTREFRAQLTTTVESALRRIMFEIMNVFDNSLHDHRLELAQKGEEVAQLKIKLQRLEIRLKDTKCGGDGDEYKTTTLTDHLKRGPEAFPLASEQTSEIPEIDFEVPDDWCAPLGCEVVTKQEEGICPSVRLRQLYIPLRPVHLSKQEVDNRITPEQKRGRRRASSSERRMPTRHRWESHNHKEEAQQSPARNNTFDLKKDSITLRDRAKGLKGGNKTLPEEEPGSPLRSRREKRKSTATQSDSREWQKSCSGCKKKFRDPSALKSHILYCNKVKRVKNNAGSATPSQCQPDEGNRTAPNEKQEDAPLTKKNEPSKKHGSTRMHRCSYCKKRFHTQSKLNGHIRFHTGETPFECRMCPKKFHIMQALKVHIQRIHKGRMDSTEETSTAPLDIREDDQPRSPPPKNQLQQPLKRMSESPPPPSPESLDEKEKKRNQDRSLLSKWHTMGTSCDEGYACLVCQKISRSKYMLMEHFRIHTGEKPLKCELCAEKFRYRSQLSMHRRRCRTMVQCDKCEKKFTTKVKFNKHVQNHHKKWAHFCKLCGKGFLMEGRLQNHMKRHDQKGL